MNDDELALIAQRWVKQNTRLRRFLRSEFARLVISILLILIIVIVLVVAFAGLNSLTHPPQPVEIQLPTLSVIQP